MRLFLCAALTGLLLSFAPFVHAAAVPLQNATATFSQTNFNVSESIDGIDNDFVNNGWAIDPQEGQNQTAFYETVTDAGIAGGTLFTFNLEQFLFRGDHTIGHFRISITQDTRGSFSNWTVLDPISATSSQAGTVLTEQPDNSILVSGSNSGDNTYTITALTALTGITGIRLETLTDPSLPNSGPGRASPNGNFVLTEFKVDQQASPVPEPSSVVLAVFAGVIFGARFIRRRNGRA
jgi:hypothetical protein